MIDYKKHLNESQYEAVNFDQGPLLVIAGAGSGKTRTLTYRVARLVEAGVLPSAILLLTFTRGSGRIAERDPVVDLYPQGIPRDAAKGFQAFGCPV